VLVPDRLRYQLLHNHLDTVLSQALSRRSDIVVARAAMPLHDPGQKTGAGKGGEKDVE
jgi:hypothetical protein